MDRKAVFSRTSAGDAEVSGRTANLYSAIKRVLVMVDGVSTFSEISKRVAPSLRDSLDEMFRELEKGGFIKEQDQKAKPANVPKMATPPKMAVPLKVAIPKAATPGVSPPSNAAATPAVPTASKMDIPQKHNPSVNKLGAENGGNLDFMDELIASTPAQLAAKAEDGTKLDAQREAEAILRKAEQEAARIREEAERVKQRAAAEILAHEEQNRRARQEAESARAKAEKEAERERANLEAARLKAEQEARARLEEAARLQQQAEAERSKAEAMAQAAAKAREEAEKLPLQQAAQQQAANRQVEQVAQPEVKLDPFFVFESYNIQTPSQVTAPPAKKSSAVEDQSEIKLEPFSFEAPKAEPAKPAGEQAGQSDVSREPASQPVPPVAKPAERPSSREQIDRAEQQRIAAQERAKKLADEQARAWADAEKREAEAARRAAEAEMNSSRSVLKKQAPLITPVGVAAPKLAQTRINRKPFPWGKFAVILLVLAVGALYIVPYVLPMRDYIPRVEQMLAARLQQPVRIGQMAVRILPSPRLELGEIHVGEAKRFEARQAFVYFSFAALLGESKPIDNIELHGVTVAGTGLKATSSWLQQVAASEQYPVRRIAISQGVLATDVIQITGMDGELNFSPAGKFTQGNLRANAGKIELGIEAAPGSRQLISLTMHGTALPLLPNWSFDQFTVTAEVSGNGMKISNFEGQLLGGKLEGEANIDWGAGWRVQGTLAAKNIAVQNMAQGMSGQMEGTGRYLMQSASLSALADTPALGGTFTVKDGVINGIDIVETARSSSKQSMPGGRTHFDALSGVLAVTKDALVFRQLKMDGGDLQVAGVINVAGQQLSGKITADLSKWAGMGKVAMQVAGTTDNPVLRAAR